MVAQVEKKSMQQGLNSSRLPTFTAQESQRILGKILHLNDQSWTSHDDLFKNLFLGTWDFFGLNHYTTTYTENLPNNNTVPSFFSDQETNDYHDESWPSYDRAYFKQCM